jgi:hypothetical protein
MLPGNAAERKVGMWISRASKALKAQETRIERRGPQDF